MASLILQLVLPLALLAWLAAWPLRSVAGLIVQSLAAGLTILAVSLGGLWLIPPWWTPYLLGLLWVCAAALGVLRITRTKRTAWPLGASAWVVAAVLLVLAMLALFVIVSALSGRQPDQTRIVSLEAPLRGGPYLIVSGGSNERVNAHVRTLRPTTARMAAFRGQSFGLDIVELDRWGMASDGIMPADPAAYSIFGQSVHAPCDGMVVSAIDGFPDQRVPQTDLVNRAGNHVLLECDGAIVVLGHFRRGSVAVAEGERVSAGQVLGEVGNSGASDLPHLHIHAQTPGTMQAPLSGDPLQIRIEGRYLVRGDRVHW